MNALKLTFVVCLLAGSSQATIKWVQTSETMETAIENANPGDTIIVRSGRYDTGGSVTMPSGGTQAHPVLIKAEEVGSVELTGETYLDLRQVSYVTIQGFIWTSTDVTAIKTQASHHIRITRNTFRLRETSSRKWVIIQGIWDNPDAPSHHNRIDHNLFEEKHLPGNFITIDGQADPVYQSSQYDRIDHNHFRNMGPRVENEMEAVRMGWSEMSMSSGFTTLEFNLFENCDGDPEIVSVKTCDNDVRHNTFRSSQGTLSLRHGNRSRVEGNFFFGEEKAGSGGIRLYGDDHVIVNNYFFGLLGSKWDAPLTLTNGDYDGGTSYSNHFRINRAQIVNNTLVNNTRGIEIGFTNNGSYLKPPRDVILKNNLVQGSVDDLIITYTEPVNMSWVSNLMYASGTAQVGLTLSDEEIRVMDPQLQKSEELFRPLPCSPLIDAGSSTNLSEIDIDGQERVGNPDIGCDEYHTDSLRLYYPLTARDVGPQAGVLVPIVDKHRSETVLAELKIMQYPNPFNSMTHLKLIHVPKGPVSVHLFDIRGRYMMELWHGLNHAASVDLNLNLHNMDSGTYLIIVRSSAGDVARRIQYLK